jgi:hypothetical protein
MSLVALDGTPLVMVGHVGVEGGIILNGTSSVVQDAANEAIIMVGQIFTEDGSSHTIDTTGSSSLGYRTASVTFANAGSSFKVGLSTVDTATGPPARAANVADVITFSVSKTHAGAGGTPTTDAWQENVPDAGTMTIANGDLVAFCTQMTARAGADTIAVRYGLTVVDPSRPSVTGYVGAAYTAQTGIPNAVITFSDGKLGFFYGGEVFTTASSNQTWNNTSGTKEYGNFMQLPVPGKAYGVIVGCSMGGDTDVVLYSDPLGTPVAQKTVSVDRNTIGGASAIAWNVHLFSSPYSFTANQPLGIILKPSSATNITAPYLSFNAAAHQKSLTLGTNGYAINRNAGAFAAQNSSKDRYAIGLLVGAFEHGVQPTYALGI